MPTFSSCILEPRHWFSLHWEILIMLSQFPSTFLQTQGQKKKKLVSRNVGDKKNLHPGSHQFCSFGILVVFVFACCFLKLKIYILIHIQLCRWVSDFTCSISGNNTTFFGWKEDVHFHRKTNDYADAYWDSLCDNLRDVAWEDIFKVGAIAAAATEFCELVVDV